MNEENKMERMFAHEDDRSPTHEDDRSPTSKHAHGELTIFYLERAREFVLQNFLRNELYRM